MTESPEVVNLFKNWLHNLLGYKDTEINESLTDLEGTREMFATALKKHDDELKRTSEQKGLEKGLEKGFKKGKMETARNMQEKGYRLEEIVEITGLSLEILAKSGIR